MGAQKGRRENLHPADYCAPGQIKHHPKTGGSITDKISHLEEGHECSGCIASPTADVEEMGLASNRVRSGVWII